MTIKEAIFKALKDLNKPVTSKEILEYIEKNNLYKFGAKNPIGVISAELRKIRLKGDQRLGILGEGRTKLYFYKLGMKFLYLQKYLLLKVSMKEIYIFCFLLT